MSRIGKLPINVPAGVTVTVDQENLVTVKGSKGTLSQKVHKDITVKQEGQVILVSRPSDSKPHRAMHGLYRALIQNMVTGVTQGFSKTLVMEGVGYRATAEGGKKLTLAVGYSHPVVFDAPKDISFETPAPTKIVVHGIDKRPWRHRRRTSARCASPSPTWARASATRTSTFAARKARPARSKERGDRKCSKSGIATKCA